MDICWQGKDITIQRSQQGRTPFGAFQAFETETGLPVPQLTATNCGKMLLGIDREVFYRTGFLRLTDLPVTDDGALRDRLNALVTTGDESGVENKLTESLNKLRNACRHNKTGKLPEAERQREEILAQIRKIEELNSLRQALLGRQQALSTYLSDLQNHKVHLLYENARQEAALLEKAKASTALLTEEIEALQKEVATQPPAEETRYKLKQLSALQEKWAILQEKTLPTPPQKPDSSPIFAGLSGEEAIRQARSDLKAWEMLQKPISPLFWILAALSFALGIALTFVSPVFIATGAALGAVFMALHSRNATAQKADRERLQKPYGETPPEGWLALAESYRHAMDGYEIAQKAYEEARTALEREKAVLSAELGTLTLGKSVSECMQLWNDSLRKADDLQQLHRDLTAAQSHENALSSVIKTVSKPETEDALTLSPEETEKAILTTQQAIARLTEEGNQYEGQMRLLGEISTYQQRLEGINRRISQLEEYYAALTIALETAQTASQNLQRKFAPGISQEAQRIFQSLTGGRYARLILNQDFTLQTEAEGEASLHGSLWRSDGTVDQLYLALRLAVSKTLSPDAPLVLDDALVRYDDTRLAAAMALLKSESTTKQILLFTCQTREQLTVDS